MLRVCFSAVVLFFPAMFFSRLQVVFLSGFSVILSVLRRFSLAAKVSPFDLYSSIVCFFPSHVSTFSINTIIYSSVMFCQFSCCVLFSSF